MIQFSIFKCNQTCPKGLYISLQLRLSSRGWTGGSFEFNINNRYRKVVLSPSIQTKEKSLHMIHAVKLLVSMMNSAINKEHVLN